MWVIYYQGSLAQFEYLLNILFWQIGLCEGECLGKCNARNGDKLVHVTHIQSRSSYLFEVVKMSIVCSLLLSVVSQLIGMALSEDTEGSLTPVDFIQLQQYMEGEF